MCFEYDLQVTNQCPVAKEPCCQAIDIKNPCIALLLMDPRRAVNIKCHNLYKQSLMCVCKVIINKGCSSLPEVPVSISMGAVCKNRRHMFMGKVPILKAKTMSNPKTGT